MATAFEFRVQEHFDAFFRHCFADHPSAHRQNIRVIMLAAQPRARDIMRKRATDMRMAVGSDRNADARPADQNAAVPKSSHFTSGRATFRASLRAKPRDHRQWLLCVLNAPSRLRRPFVASINQSINQSPTVATTHPAFYSARQFAARQQTFHGQAGLSHELRLDTY
jgi:hypothetical protein